MTWTFQQAIEDLRKRLDELALTFSRDENELKPILTGMVWILELLKAEADKCP